MEIKSRKGLRDFIEEANLIYCLPAVFPRYKPQWHTRGQLFNLRAWRTHNKQPFPDDDGKTWSHIKGHQMVSGITSVAPSGIS